MAGQRSSSLSELDQLLGSLLMLARTTERVLERVAVARAVPTPLSLSKVQILRLLHRAGSRTSTQLANFLDVSKPAVTQIVDSMVRASLVTRSPADDDRRKVQLALTRKGAGAFRAIQRRQREVLRFALERGGRKTAAWSDILCGVSEALSHVDDKSTRVCLQCEAFIEDECLLSAADVACPYQEQMASDDGPRRVRPAGSAARRPRKTNAKTPAARGRPAPKKRRGR